MSPVNAGIPYKLVKLLEPGRLKLIILNVSYAMTYDNTSAANKPMAWKQLSKRPNSISFFAMERENNEK